MEGKDTTTDKPTSSTLVGSSGKKYRDSPKFNEWFRLVFDKTRRDTFGNFTQAALLAYNLDENDPTQYNSASKIGSMNYRKVKDLASPLMMQKKGFTFAMWIDILMAKMATSQSAVWWEIAGELAGWRERKPQINVNQNNQYNVYTLDDNELSNQFQDIASETLREETFAAVFVEGDVSAGDEQIPPLAVDQEEPGSGDPADESLQTS